jgi:hypothetical protein
LRTNKYSNIPAIKKLTIWIFANMKYGDRQEVAARKACRYYFLLNSKRAVPIHPSGKYVTLAIEPRFHVSDISSRPPLNHENEDLLPRWRTFRKRVSWPFMDVVVFRLINRWLLFVFWRSLYINFEFKSHSTAYFSVIVGTLSMYDGNATKTAKTNFFK